ncbi:four helix bundle protein [uncultured Alistipes sp.]|uniref:four helix bundle protein n=2 Tax=uncultured Alistipes sp. TaxID=538949 RepID=UPI0023C2D176|nr:four helix bundle protein [uncultured Alistipes sp.]MDE6827473.1 four helix bundle protein [Alistipes sp.]
MKTDNVVSEKSLTFAIRIVRLYQHLTREKHEYVLSKQMLKSGTSVGANIREALRGQSRQDFAAKMNISLKEINETEYWLELLYRTDYITDKEFRSIFADCKELVRILTSIVKTTREKTEL